MTGRKHISTKFKKLLYNANIQNEKWLKKEALKINDPYTGKRNYLSNIKKQIKIPANIICRRKDIVIENILDKGYYNFHNALFIINSFGYSPLTGLLIFNTNKPCKVKYTIKGQNHSSDYTNCDETFTLRHQVPVLGLYESCVNTIIFYLLDKDNKEFESNTIKIKCSRISTVLHNHYPYVFKLPCTSKIFPQINTILCKGLVINKSFNCSAHFIMATGGYGNVNYAFDNNANIRWYLTMPVHPYGIHMLSNGHMLVPDKRIRRPNYGNAHSVTAYEIDYLGRIYKTIYHKSGFHHWAVSRKDNGNILMATSSINDTYMENNIDEIDKNTGEVLRPISANQLFDSTYITRYDWAHVNSFEYIHEEDAIIVSYRNIHTIAKISFDKNEIIWLLANPVFYKKTKQADKVLKPGKNIKWFFQQHGIKILERINENGNKKIKIALFDNHTANRRPVKYFDNIQKSNLMVFTIDETNMEVQIDKVIPVPPSITRSNIEFDQKNNCIYAMCANMKDEEVKDHAKILGYNYSTNECITDISLNNDFFIAKLLNFNLSNIKNTFKKDNIPLYIGKLYSPVAAKELPASFNKDNLLPAGLKRKLVFSLNGNILQVLCKDHSVQKIFLYNDNIVFMQYFDDTKQLTKVFKEQHYIISMPLENISIGKYQIGIEYLKPDNNETKNSPILFNTGYWIEIH